MPSDPNDPPAHIDLDKLMRAHQHQVASALARAGVATRDIPDLTQEVFIVAHRRLQEWRGDAKLSTWLHRVAQRVASDHRRRAYQRREHLPGLDAATLEAAPELPALERHEQRVQLKAALDQLSEEQQQAIVGYEVEELTIAELAKRTQVPHKTLYSRLYAARKHLKQLLVAQGWTIAATLASAACKPQRCLAALRTWLISPTQSLLVACCLLLYNPAPAKQPTVAVSTASSSQHVERLTTVAPHQIAATMQPSAAQTPPQATTAKKKPVSRKRLAPELEPHNDLKIIHVGALEPPETLPFHFERIEPPPKARITISGPRDAASTLEKELTH